MISSSNFGPPSNYVGTNPKWKTLLLKIRKRKKPIIAGTDPKELGGVGNYFPRFL